MKIFSIFNNKHFLYILIFKKKINTKFVSENFLCNSSYFHFFEYLFLSTIIFKIKNEKVPKKSSSFSEIVSNGIKIL